MGIHIVVCIKQTPSTSNIQIDPVTGTLKREGMAAAINPFDEYAIEEGVRIKERVPGSTVSVITMGPPQAEEALREAIARGCDNGFHVTSRAFAGADTWATSYTLTKGIQKIMKEKGPVQLVICGKQTNDGDTGHVGPGIGAWLDWPNVAYVKKVEAVDDKKIVVHRMMEDGTDVLEMQLPAVMAVVKEINEPRVASLKGKMAAKKAVIPKWNEVDLECDKANIGLSGSPTIVAKSFNPPPRKGGVRIEGNTPQEKAKNLVDRLQELKVHLMPNTIFVTQDRCTGCTSCARACPVTCIDMVDRPKEPGVPWRKLAIIDEVRCIFCNACVEACDKLHEKSKNKNVFHAITMAKEQSTVKIDTSLYKGVWIYAEMRHGKLMPTAYELLHVAKGLAATLQEEIAAVIIGKDVGQHAQDLIDRGADKVYVLDNPLLENFVDEIYTQLFSELIVKEKPNKLLMPASTLGRSFASRVAITAKTGITADATELSIDPKTRMLHATRPSFGGNLMATILCEKHRPEMATVRPMSFPRAEKQSGRQGKVVNVPVDPSKIKQRTKFVRYEKEQAEVQDISTAEIIVSGGRGVGGKDGFKPVEDLAKVLGGALGASRAAVDAGWIPYRHQIGLTGRTVRPKLYIAAGISGQIQHLAGMSSSDVIVAINRDPESPLMKMATFSIEGDLFEVVPAITQEVQKRRGH